MRASVPGHVTGLYLLVLRQYSVAIKICESIDWRGFYFLESKKLSIIVYRLHIGIIVS
jgi:hypothetical protein